MFSDPQMRIFTARNPRQRISIHIQTKRVMQNFFVKTHGLGNDYIVLNQDDITFQLTPENIKKICDVHYGIGSDGILLKVPSTKANFGLKIYNPDGSEAEKAGTACGSLPNICTITATRSKTVLRSKHWADL
jgi:diaminopimelate epimerase